MEPLIEVKELKKVFYTKAGALEVLKGINLKVNHSEMLAIVGASGVGKSTLLHILGTLDRPTEGQVLYDGKEIFSLTDEELSHFRNKKIGFVFQFHHLLSDFTALENVMMPLLVAGLNWDEAKQRAENLLQTLGIGGRLNHKPAELSGGEQQRVAVARALVVNPLVVLADEPTGNLDTSTGRALFQLLKDLNKRFKTTFIIVTHNEEIANQCDRVVKMVDGRLLGG